MQGTKSRAYLSAALARRSSRRVQRGASLLEAIAYLGIAAIVVIGAVALLNGAFNSAGSNDLTQQISAIQTGVKKLYMGQQTGYTGVDDAVLSSAGVLPSTIPVDAQGKATDTWGGAITVASPNQGSFTISYANVPDSVCITAVTGAGSWTGVSVNGTAQAGFPVTPTQAQTACNAGNNTIVWSSS
ncbi:MAG TPA: type 4 pilus major pilin [Trinickia sp.]|nr:type 4 pilus major pilin [Trinickia sp.]